MINNQVECWARLDHGESERFKEDKQTERGGERWGDRGGEKGGVSIELSQKQNFNKIENCN